MKGLIISSGLIVGLILLFSKKENPLIIPNIEQQYTPIELKPVNYEIMPSKYNFNEYNLKMPNIYRILFNINNLFYKSKFYKSKNSKIPKFVFYPCSTKGQSNSYQDMVKSYIGVINKQ